MKRLLGLTVLLAPDLAAAHAGIPSGWGWSFDPAVVVPLAVAALGYGVGSMRLRRRPSSLRICAFALGWLALVLALLSPLDTIAQVSFSMHMTQHVILVALAPPLLVFGMPLAPFLMALPRRWRRWVGRNVMAGIMGRLVRRLSKIPAAVALHGLALWSWHMPAAYQAALSSEPVHVAQHTTLLGTALLFWWSVIHSGRYGRFGQGSGVIGLFVTALHAKLLGVLIAFAPAPLYPFYFSTASPWILSPLQDQQMAGLIMLVPVGIVYLLTGIGLMAAWLATADRRQPPKSPRSVGPVSP